MIYQICDVMMSVSTWGRVHFWVYLLNCNSLTHQTWLIDRYMQGQWFSGIFWTIWELRLSFRSFSSSSNYSITSYVKIPVFQCFEKIKGVFKKGKCQYLLVLPSDEWWLIKWDCQAWDKAGILSWQEKLACRFSERTTGLFKPEFVGTRGVWLTAKCYLVQNEALNKNKYSCKGVSQEHNDLNFQRYENVLDVFLKTRRDNELAEKDIDQAKNVGFTVYD